MPALSSAEEPAHPACPNPDGLSALANWFRTIARLTNSY